MTGKDTWKSRRMRNFAIRLAGANLNSTVRGGDIWPTHVHRKILRAPFTNEFSNKNIYIYILYIYNFFPNELKNDNFYRESRNHVYMESKWNEFREL